MAEATKFENVRNLIHGATLSGPGKMHLLLTAGSDTAVLTLTIGSDTLVISAIAGTSQELGCCLKLGGGISATISLTGTAAKAYAIDVV